jgi:hypothetical protein
MVNITEETCITLNRAGMCMYLPVEHIVWTILTVVAVILVIGYAFSEGMSTRTPLGHIIDLHHSAPYASRQCGVGRQSEYLMDVSG